GLPGGDFEGLAPPRPSSHWPGGDVQGVRHFEEVFLSICFGGVNIGGDTDTIATIAGAMAGAFAGAGEIPPAHIDLIERQNQVDLRGLAQKVARCLAGER
ncbi:ADP-ribosylglycohydrolase family protein, partial [Bittarella massiliensis (ex Durand et al. 2017)]